MKESIKPFFFAIGGGSIIEFISGSEFELIYKYSTQTITMLFSMFIAWKHYKNNQNKKNQNSSN
jgi:hypothetical protein